MAYSKGIAVQYRRGVNIGIFDDEISNSSYLSDFDLSSINELITELTELVESEDGGMIWGQEQIMIDSSPEISFCKDEMHRENLGKVPTRSLLNLMIEIQKLKTEYQNPDNLKKKIGEAFAIIKSDPDNHKRWLESNIDFMVIINDIYISLVLMPKDFELTVEEYTNQLKFAFY